MLPNHQQGRCFGFARICTQMLVSPVWRVGSLANFGVAHWSHISPNPWDLTQRFPVPMVSSSLPVNALPSPNDAFKRAVFSRTRLP